MVLREMHRVVLAGDHSLVTAPWQHTVCNVWQACTHTEMQEGRKEQAKAITGEVPRVRRAYRETGNVTSIPNVYV